MLAVTPVCLHSFLCFRVCTRAPKNSDALNPHCFVPCAIDGAFTWVHHRLAVGQQHTATQFGVWLDPTTPCYPCLAVTPQSGTRELTAFLPQHPVTDCPAAAAFVQIHVSTAACNVNRVKQRGHHHGHQAIPCTRYQEEWNAVWRRVGEQECD